MNPDHLPPGPDLLYLLSFAGAKTSRENLRLDIHQKRLEGPMKSVRRLFVSLVFPVLLLLPATATPDGFVQAQEAITPQRPIPGPVVPPRFFRAALERGTRSPDGSPGPDYWQVYSDYDIDARLDPVSGLLSGTETIRFHNRSPADLPSIALFLHQNIHAEGVPRNTVRHSGA